ncbi:MAG: hypothetical protein K6E62_02065 [Lachnospiraceae bacterium]|nr:hypothetical protein [Lachnospiraceae bacterium]
MKLHRLMGNTGYTTFGCMWEKGICDQKSDYVCRNSDGESIPIQSRITALWPDGSVKWTAHTADSLKCGNDIIVLPLDALDADRVPASEGGTAVECADEGGTVDKCAVESGTTGKPGVHSGTTEGMRLTKQDDGFCILNGQLIIKIPFSGDCLISEVFEYNGDTIHDAVSDTPECPNASEHLDSSECTNAAGQNSKGSADLRTVARRFRPDLVLTGPTCINGNPAWEERHFSGRIDNVTVEEEGPLMCAFRFDGTHIDKTGVERFRFVIRLKVFYNSRELKFTHTFIYDGEPEKDYLKALSVVFEMPACGEMYNRHIKFATDHGTFHESAMTMISWRPRVPKDLHAAQMRGELLKPEGDELAAVNKIMEDIPFWDTYDLCQDSDSHFEIRKKLEGDDLCYIDALNGNRAKGAAFVGTTAGGVMFAIRDFWEKYPSGFTIEGLTRDNITVRMHLWSPEARPFDFRHYARRGYNQVCYEGYDYKGADPYGIACTNELSVKFTQPGMVPGEKAGGGHSDQIYRICVTDAELLQYASDVNTTTLFVGDPEYYHDLRAFGYWSLVKDAEAAGIDPALQSEMPGDQNGTDLQKKLEKDLARCFEFYKNEVEQRKWYGMFN